MRNADFNRAVNFAKQLDGVRNYKVVALYREHNFMVIAGNSLKTHPDSQKLDSKTGIIYSSSHAEMTLLRKLKSEVLTGTLYVLRFRHRKNGELVIGCSKPCPHCATHLRDSLITTHYINEVGVWETMK